jgi:hypothetical protein
MFLIPPPPPSPHRYDSLLFEEIVALLAEALVLDFQAHANITGNSPPLIDRKTSLTGGFAEE